MYIKQILDRILKILSTFFSHRAHIKLGITSMLKFVFAFFGLFYTFSLYATPLDNIIFFGDSLTDNGNLYRVMKLPKSPPYYQGRFSNGLTWAEHISEVFQKKYGTISKNYAVGGATVILRRPVEGALPYTLKQEIKAYLKNALPNLDSTLFVIWIGGNDYLYEKKQQPAALVTDVVNELVNQIKVLIMNGSKKFILMDLPDLSKIPHAKNLDQNTRDRLLTLTQLHHVKLAEAAQSLQKQYPTVTFIFSDIYTIFNDMLRNIDEYNEKYQLRIQNTSDACLSNYVIAKPSGRFGEEIPGMKSSECADADSYVFWDAIHPSAAAHRLIAMTQEPLFELQL